MAAKKLVEHLELENFFGHTKVQIELIGEEKLMLLFVQIFSAIIPFKLFTIIDAVQAQFTILFSSIK